MMPGQFSAVNGSLPYRVAESSRRRRYWLYFLLAAFDVFAISVSLYLNHRIMSIYARSVEVNQTWAAILGESSHLAQLASAINAPGNNVFESESVEAETQRMRTSLEDFYEHLGAFRKRIAAEAAPGWTATLTNALDAVQRAVADMAEEAEHLFSAFPTDRGEAGNRMARMDRRYDNAHIALLQLREHIGMIQNQAFASQTATAASLQKSEYAIGGLILLMVAGATFYGFQTAKQEEIDAREREQARQRKQVMEERTRVLKQVMAAQEEERRRVARDLHDEVGQSLTSLLIGLRTVAGASSLPQARDQIEELRRIASLALDEVRRMARGLRPTVLDDLGLAAALERYGDDFAQAHNLHLDVATAGINGERLPDTVETALYRIAQEALTNVARHASARHAALRVERHAGGVEMSISDDGCGFDCRAVLGERSLGLSGMRERAALLDGAITIESKAGAGTHLTVRLPLSEVSDAENSRLHRR
jgi:signal transduction histidine kinase